jgi:hypothetical protein
VDSKLPGLEIYFFVVSVWLAFAFKKSFYYDDGKKQSHFFVSEIREDKRNAGLK